MISDNYGLLPFTLCKGMVPTTRTTKHGQHCMNIIVIPFFLADDPPGPSSIWEDGGEHALHALTNVVSVGVDAP